MSLAFSPAYSSAGRPQPADDFQVGVVVEELELHRQLHRFPRGIHPRIFPVIVREDAGRDGTGVFHHRLAGAPGDAPGGFEAVIEPQQFSVVQLLRAEAHVVVGDHFRVFRHPLQVGDKGAR